MNWHVNGRPQSRRPSLAQGWREEVCGRVLLDVLAGKRGLRVVDPEADIPVSIDEFKGAGE